LFRFYKFNSLFLCIKDNNNNTNRLLIHYFDITSNWVSDQSAEPQNKDLFINIINKFLSLSDMKFIQSYDSVNVFVQSNDAGDRCGVFIASSILFNSISVASQFDVAQIVRQLRASRANMISNFDTYKLLYELCRQFIKNMDKLLLLVND
jgi:protein tyrosine phosphatase